MSSSCLRSKKIKGVYLCEDCSFLKFKGSQRDKKLLNALKNWFRVRLVGAIPPTRKSPPAVSLSSGLLFKFPRRNFHFEVQIKMDEDENIFRFRPAGN